MPREQWPPFVEDLDRRKQLRWRFEQWESKVEKENEVIACAVLSSDLRSVVLVRNRGILELPQGKGLFPADAARVYADACGTFAAGSAWRLAAEKGLTSIFALRAPSRWFDGTSLSGAVRYNEAICYDGYPTFAAVDELVSMEQRGEVPEGTWWMVAMAINVLIGGAPVMAYERKAA